MTDNGLWNSVTAAISVALGLLALINEKLRVAAATTAAVLILAVVVYGLFNEIDNLKRDQQRILERVDIYRELVDIKADIKSLRRGKT